MDQGHCPREPISVSELRNARFDSRLSIESIYNAIERVLPQDELGRDDVWCCGPISACNALALLGCPMDHDMTRMMVLTCPRAAAHLPVGPRPAGLRDHINQLYRQTMPHHDDNEHSKQARNWDEFVTMAQQQLKCQRPVIILIAYSQTLLHYVNIVASQGTDKVVILDTNQVLYEMKWGDLHKEANKRGSVLQRFGLLSTYNWIRFACHQTFFDRIGGGVDNICSLEFYQGVFRTEPIFDDHFYIFGQFEGRVSSPWFHVGWYREQYQRQYGFSDAATVEHMLTDGLHLGLRLSPHFNPVVYLAENIELFRVYVDQRKLSGKALNGKLLEHWIRDGLDQGRPADANLCFASYLRRYSDLQRSFGPRAYKRAALHWYEHGQRENRDCSRAR